MKGVNRREIVCPVCGSTSFKSVHLYHEAFGKRFDRLACQHCGLITLYPMLTKDEIERLYSIDYFQKDYRGESAKPYQEAIVDIQADFKRRVLPLIQLYLETGKGVRALEIGCAGGAVLKVLSEAGFSAIGVELNPQIAEWGKKELGVDIRVGTLEEQGFPDAFFDVVYMGDVLEHIPEPVKFLSEVWRVMTQNALLIIDIPFEMNAILPRLYYGLLANLLFIMSKYERLSPYPPYHVFVYNPKTIKQLMKKNGFRVISLRQAKILRLSSWKVLFDAPNFLLTKMFNILGDRATIVARKTELKEVI